MHEQLFNDQAIRYHCLFAKQLLYSVQQLRGFAVLKFFCCEQLLLSALLRSSIAFNQFLLEDIIQVVLWRQQQQVSDFCRNLWTERAHNIMIRCYVVRCDVMPLAANCASTCTNKICGSVIQTGGISWNRPWRGPLLRQVLQITYFVQVTIMVSWSICW